MKTPVRSRNIGVQKSLSFGFICDELNIYIYKLLCVKNRSDWLKGICLNGLGADISLPHCLATGICNLDLAPKATSEYNALAPRPEVLRSISYFYGNFGHSVVRLLHFGIHKCTKIIATNRCKHFQIIITRLSKTENNSKHHSYAGYRQVLDIYQKG